MHLEIPLKTELSYGPSVSAWSYSPFEVSGPHSEIRPAKLTNHSAHTE